MVNSFNEHTAFAMALAGTGDMVAYLRSSGERREVAR